MNIKNTFLKLAQKLGSGILYGRPVLQSKCWVPCIQSWQALVVANVMGSGAGGSGGEERGKAAPFAAASFPGFVPHRRYFAEEIWLEPTVAAVQNGCNARMRRKRDGCGRKTTTSKWSEGRAGNTWPLFPARIQRYSDFLRYALLGKMGKISSHTEVVWFLLIGDTCHLISGLCSILKAFYGEEESFIQSRHSLQTVENAVATSQGIVHLSIKELTPEWFEDSDIASRSKKQDIMFFILQQQETCHKKPQNSDAFHKHRRTNFLPDPKNGTDVKMSQL